MNRFIALISILLLSSTILGQAKRFKETLKNCPSKWYDTSLVATSNRLDVFRLDEDYLSSISIKGINAKRKQRLRSNFEQDTLLNQICVSGINSFFRSRFKRRSTWRKEQKTILRALEEYQSDCNIFSARAFMIDLLDWPLSSAFYYLKKSTKTELKLFQGKQPPSTNPVVDGYEEPIPIETVTEKQFVDRIIETIPRKGPNSDLLSRKYSRIGIAMKIDASTLNRERRPRVYVILVLAGKRLQGIRLKPFVTEELEKNYPYDE